MRMHRHLAGPILGLLLFLGASAPALAAGTVLMADGGGYFTPYGPPTYWHLDWGKGYCGNVAACPGSPPTYVHWTYVNQAAGDMNDAYWQNPAPVAYPEYASAFIPARNATATATYTVVYNGVSRQAVTMSQLPYYNQWVRLNAGGLYKIQGVWLGDQSWYGTASDKVAFDEIKIEN